jgi:hypothetical protein
MRRPFQEFWSEGGIIDYVRLSFAPNDLLSRANSRRSEVKSQVEKFRMIS